jgi:CRP-like cAMP-binding protein
MEGQRPRGVRATWSPQVAPQVAAQAATGRTGRDRPDRPQQAATGGIGMRSLRDYLPEHPFLAGMDRRLTDEISEYAENVHVAAGRLLFRAGDPADHFYLVRRGEISVELRAPDGELIVLHTAGPGDVVGWSWLQPGYPWLFDARAVTECSAVRLTAIGLLRRCREDRELGYALMQRVATLMYRRLHDLRDLLLAEHGPRELAG